MLIGVGIGILAFFFGDDAITAVTSVIRGQQPPAPGEVKVVAFNDADANGQVDTLNPAEHPVPQATIVLQQGETQIENQTNTSGALELTDVPPGDYQIIALYRDVQVSVSPTSVTVPSDQGVNINLALNSAGEPRSFVGGAVRVDANGNGLAEPNEPALGEAVVELKTPQNEILQQPTTVDGLFEFTGLDSGEYTLGFVLDEALMQNYQLPGVLEKNFELRSELDSVSVLFLVEPKEQNTQSILPKTQYRLAQASPPTEGFEITKAASDADEQQVEFVHTEPGGSLLFEIIVEVKGSGASFTDVEVFDDYPDELTVETITGGGIDDGDTITWDLGTLTNGDVVNLSYTARVSSSATDGMIDNVAEVSGNGATPMSDDTTIVIGSEPRDTTNVTFTTIDTTNGTNVTNVPPGSTPTSNVPVVGVESWLMTLLLALPIVALGTALLLGWRRARN
jgi:hypothetical protein